MTAQEVLKTVEGMSWEDWATIQNGIAEMMAAEMSSEEIEEVRAALAEADAEFERGEGMTGEELRSKLGLL